MLLVQTDLMTVHVLNISSGYEFDTICGAWVLAGCAWLLACRHHLLSGMNIPAFLELILGLRLQSLWLSV